MQTMNRVKLKPLDIIGLLFCCGIGLGLSLYAWKKLNFLGWDEAVYVTLGKNLALGNGYIDFLGKPHLWFPPAFPVAISLFARFISDAALAGHLTSLTAFTLSIFLLYALAYRLYGRLAAFASAFLFVINSGVLAQSFRVYTHAFDMLFILIALHVGVTVLGCTRIRYWQYAVFGGALGVGILTRPENIVTAVAVIVTLFLLVKAPFKRKAAAFGVLALVLFLMVFPYARFLHAHTGKWTLTSKIRNIADCAIGSGQGPTGDHAGLVTRFDAFEYVKHNKKALFKRYFVGIERCTYKFSFLSFLGLGFIFIGAGLFSGHWDVWRARQEVLLCSFLAYTIFLPLTNFRQRYFLFTIPVLVVWMGKGVSTIIERIRNGWALSQRQAIAFAAGILLLATPTTIYQAATMSPNGNYFYASDVVGRWMRENVDDRANKRVAVFCNDSSVIFNSGTQQVFLPPEAEDNLALLRDYVKKEACDYLVVRDKNPQEQYNQGVIDFFRSLQEDDTYRRLYSFEGARSMWLFEVKR